MLSVDIVFVEITAINEDDSSVPDNVGKMSDFLSYTLFRSFVLYVTEKQAKSYFSTSLPVIGHKYGSNSSYLLFIVYITL